MERVGIYDAKARLPEIVGRVEAGSEVLITRRGKVVARIVPVKTPATDKRAAAAKHIRALREKWAIDRVNIRKLINEGRR
jgi:prevent-host-death family protein